MKNRFNPFLGTLAVIAMIQAANAASVTWNVAGDGNWDTSTGNWTGGSPTANLYANGDTATFTNAAGGNISLSGTIAPTATNVSAASGTYTFSGTGITSGTLVKSGAGTLVLSGANTYSGATTVSAGALALANADAVQNSAVTLNSGSTLQLRGNSDTVFNSSGAVALQSVSAPSVTLDVNNNGSGTGNTLTLANGISYNAPSITAGTYTTTINATGGNGYTLAIPSVTYNNGYSYASGSPRNFILKFNPTSASISLGDVTLAGSGSRVTVALTLDGTSTGNEITGVIAMPTGRALTKSGIGTWTLSGANTYTGNTLISGGKIALGNTLALQNSAFDTASVNGGLDVTGYATPTLGGLTGSVSLSSTLITGYGSVTRLTLNPQSGISQTYSGSIVNGASGMNLTKSGAGTQILSGTNSYTGSTTISAGTLKFTKTASLYSGTTGDWTAANIKVGNTGVLALNVGGTDQFTTGHVTTLLTNLGGANGTSTTGFAAGSSINFDTTNASGSTFTVADNMGNSTGAGGGAIGLIKSGTNTLELTGTNTYGGTTTVSGGTLKVSGTGSINPTTGAALNLGSGGSAGTLQYESSATSKFAAINVGNGTNNNGTLNQTDGTINGASLSLGIGLGSGIGVVSLSGGSMALTGAAKIGSRNSSAIPVASTLTLSNAASFTATSLSLATDNNYTAAGTVTQGGTSTVNLGVGALSLAGINSANAAIHTGIYNLNGGTLTAGSVSMTAATGLGTNTGTFNFNGGTLTAGNDNTSFMPVVAGFSAKVQSGGAKIDTSTFAITIGAALTEDSGSTGGGLTKSGTGTLTLTGTNTYTGATQVTAGTLTVNGALANTITTTISSGATLGGTGSIGGAVTINSGGTLAPGASAGTLAINNTLGLNETSILDFELNPFDTSIGGGVNDLVTGVTSLTLDGLLNVTATSGSFSGITSGTWRLFNYSGSLTNNILTLNTMPTLASGYSWNLDTATSNQINLTIVPEPRAALIGGLGLLTLLRRRRAF